MRFARIIITSLFLVGFVFCFSSASYSQGTHLGTIRGTVVDEKGASVPNASVQVTDLATNISQNTTTNGEGDYEAPNLKSGSYKVTITAPGFKTTVVSAVLSGSDVVRADVRLEVGEPSAMVDITAEAGLIQTETPTIGGAINNKQLIELPRDSRDIYQFLYLSPNITTSADGTDFKFIGAQSYGAAFSLDGQRSNGGIFGGATASQPSLEAISDLTILSNNFTAEYAGIANIRVDTKRGEKDFHGSLFYNNKNSALAAWTIQDKNDLARFNRDGPNPARPDFPKPYFNLNETGGSISGPLKLFGNKKTFFLGAYERRWSVDTFRFAGRNTLPGQRLLNADFSQLTNSLKPAVPAAILPLLTPAELAANTVLVGTTRRFINIPSRFLNPTVAKLLQVYYPTSSLTASVDPRGRLTDFAQNVPTYNTRDLVTARIDHDFTANDKLYAVYNYQNNPSRAGSVTGSPNVYPAFGLRDNEQSNHTLSLSYSKLFSSNFVNEARGGFNSQSVFRKAPRTLREFLSGIGFSDTDITNVGSVLGPAALDTPGHTAISVANFALIQNGGRSVNRTLDQKLVTFGDTLTWIKGLHSLKGGVDVVRNHGTDGFVANRQNPRGRINYTGGAATDAWARYLIGLPPNNVQFVEKLRGDLDATNFEYGFFAQDEYKIHPRVTLNLGLRYELITPFKDKENLLVNFDPNFVDPTTHRKGRFIVPTLDVLPQIDPRIINYGVVDADTAGVGPGLVNSDRNNFAPRLGIAWRLNDRTVLRGGYGIFYPTASAQGIRDALASSPFNHPLRKNNAAVPLGGWPGGLTPPGVTPFTGGVLAGFDSFPDANSIPVDIQQPRIEQFNATFEREMPSQIALRVSYLGTRMHGLIGGFDLNMLPPNDIPFGTHGFDDDGNIVICDPNGDIGCDNSIDAARRPFPELGSYMARYGNFGSGRSHALQIEVNRRFVNGLTFNASYTLLDQKGDGFDTGNASLGGTFYNQFDTTNDFARDAFVSRHRFVSYGIYELPFGKGKKYGNDLPTWVDAAFGGFQLSWNMFAKSGTGFTPYWRCDVCDPFFPGNIGSEFIDAIGGFDSPTFRPLIVSSNQYIKQGDQFFNPDAFAVPSVGSDLLSNPNVAKRNILTGPGTWGVNLGVRKFFKFSDTTRLEVGADFNNVFNHPLRSPNDMYFAELGTFNLEVDQTTGRLLPITDITRNEDFGRINTSFTQEGIDNRRLIRLRLRLTF